MPSLLDAFRSLELSGPIQKIDFGIGIECWARYINLCAYICVRIDIQYVNFVTYFGLVYDIIYFHCKSVYTSILVFLIFCNTDLGIQLTPFVDSQYAHDVVLTSIQRS